MSKKSGSRKDHLEEEGKKKKKRFDDDPIVKKYTATGSDSLKQSSEDSKRKKKEEEEFKKKKNLDQFGGQTKKGGYNYEYVPNFKNKALDDSDEYKKNKKDVGGILDQMFTTDNAEAKPFGNVQYNDNTKHIQKGSRQHHHHHHKHHKHHKEPPKEPKPSPPPPTPPPREEPKPVVKEQKEIKPKSHEKVEKKDDEKKKKTVHDSSSSGKDYYSGAGGGGTTLPDSSLPNYEKRKKKGFGDDEMKDSKDLSSTPFTTNYPKYDEDTGSKKKKASSSSDINKGSTSASPKSVKDEIDDDLNAKKDKAKKEKRANLFETDDDKSKAGSGSSDFDKKKKKNDSDAGTSSTGTSTGFIPSFNKTDDEAEAFDRKKKKTFDYDTLFEKPKTDAAQTEDKFKQAYLTSQAYKSVSTSGSRTSLDGDLQDPEVTSNLSIGERESKTSVSKQSPSKSQKGSAVKTSSSKSEIKKKKSDNLIVKKKSKNETELLNRLGIKKEDASTRVKNYLKDRSNYPENYYQKIHKYFHLKSNDKIGNDEYEILGKLMESELLKDGQMHSTDDHNFLDHLNISMDEYSKRKRLKKFDDELKANHSNQMKPDEQEKFIRNYFDLKEEKLNPNEIERLNKIMNEELLAKKLSIKTDPQSKDKRMKDHQDIHVKSKNKDLDDTDIAKYYGIGLKTTTQQELSLLLELLKGEIADQKQIENHDTFLNTNQIPNDETAKQKRFNKFKTDILVTYEVGKVKYFIGKYFDKNPDEIKDKDLPKLFRIIKSEVSREMHKEPETKQDDLFRTLNLIQNEVRITKTKNFDDPSLLDEKALAERIKRFKEVILPDYQNGSKKLNYKDRISIYFNMNADSYSPDEIEAFGRLMDHELKSQGIDFAKTDDLFLQDKSVDPHENKRKERVKRFSIGEIKLSEIGSNLDTKQIVGKYYGITPDELNDEDLIHFSTFMVDELLNDNTDQSKLEIVKQVLKQKGVDFSSNEREKRKLKFKNEIEPELKTSIKNLDYASVVGKYFEKDNIDKMMNSLEIARLKRLMEREIRDLDRVLLTDKNKIKFDDKSMKDRLKIFKDQIEPDYKMGLNQLNYRTRIETFFNQTPNQLKKDDLEKLGKLIEDELIKHSETFPSDDDLFLLDLKIPIERTDKKKRILKLRNELEKNPVQSNNPSHLLKIYFDIKDMKKLDDNNLARLIKIMEEEQITVCGQLVGNQLKNKTSREKLMALMNLLQIRDIDKLKSGNKDGKNALNEQVIRLEKENASKINEMKALLEEKIKHQDQEDKSIIENMKKELDKELQNQEELKLDIAKSGIDDQDEQRKLLEKLEEQKKHLEEQKTTRLKTEAERLRKETEENYKKKLDNLDQEQKEKETKELEELEKQKKELQEKHKLEHSERKKKLLEEAEKANQENEKKLEQQFEEEFKKQLDEKKKQLDDEYQKMKTVNKEMAKKNKKEFEDERAKIEANLEMIEKKIKDLRQADEEERKKKLKDKAKELEDQNTKKLKDEAAKLETEAKVKIKEISDKLEEEMNSPNVKNQVNVEVEANKKRTKMVNDLNQENRKKLETMEKVLEKDAHAILDELAKELGNEAKKRLNKQLEEAKKEHENQLAKLKAALQKLSSNSK